MKTEAGRTDPLRNRSLEKPGVADDCSPGRIFLLFRRTEIMKISACNDVPVNCAM